MVLSSHIRLLSIVERMYSANGELEGRNESAMNGTPCAGIEALFRLDRSRPLLPVYQY
jgi:hypothetical protein